MVLNPGSVTSSCLLSKNNLKKDYTKTQQPRKHFSETLDNEVFLLNILIIFPKELKKDPHYMKKIKRNYYYRPS